MQEVAELEQQTGLLAVRCLANEFSSQRQRLDDVAQISEQRASSLLEKDDEIHALSEESKIAVKLKVSFFSCFVLVFTHRILPFHTNVCLCSMYTKFVSTSHTQQTLLNGVDTYLDRTLRTQKPVLLDIQRQLIDKLAHVESIKR